MVAWVRNMSLLSYQTYGSNTAHYLIEGSQRFLLATERTALLLGIQYFIYKIEYLLLI